MNYPKPEELALQRNEWYQMIISATGMRVWHDDGAWRCQWMDYEHTGAMPQATILRMLEEIATLARHSDLDA